MRLVATALLLFFVFCSEGIIKAQVEQISTPYLELKNEQIHISYQIINSSPNDRYKIWIEASDNHDEPIQAKALIGDIGDNVQGGGTRQIIWNYKLDHVSVEEGVFIRVLGEHMPEEATINADAENINRTGAILRSLAFPGWGLTGLNGNKSHLLKGVAAYSGIVSALVFNNLAVDSYDKYKSSYDESELNTLFQKSVRQDHISEFSAYAAIGIWLLDLVWTVAGLPGTGNLNVGKDSNVRFDIGPAHNQGFGIPMLALHINLMPGNEY